MSYWTSDEYKSKRKADRRKNPARQMLYSARLRAKKRNISFDLELSDIIIPDCCPILNIPIFVMDGKPGNNSPTLDQINPGKGYVKDNVCVISHKANTMKQDNTIEDLERLLLYMKGKLNEC